MKTFFRTTVIGTIIALSIIFGSISIAKAYENIKLVAFGEYKKAVELTENGIRILDFLIDF